MKGFKCLWLVFYEWLSHGNSHLIEHGWVKWWGEREGDGWCFDKSLHTPCSKISISRRGVQKSWGNAVFCPWLTSSYCKIYKYTTGAQMSSRPASITSHWMWAQPETHDSFFRLLLLGRDSLKILGFFMNCEKSRILKFLAGLEILPLGNEVIFICQSQWKALSLKLVDRLGSALRLHGGGNPSILDREREISCLYVAGVFLKLRSWVSVCHQSLMVKRKHLTERAS